MPMKHFVAVAALHIFILLRFQVDSNHQAKSSGRQTTKSLCSLGNNSHYLEFASWGSAADLVRSCKDLQFTKWSNWSPCSRSCITKRQRKCKVPSKCKKKVEQEQAFCYPKDSSTCFKWIYERVCTRNPEDQEYEYQEYYDYELDDNDSYEDFDLSEEKKEPKCGMPQASALTRIIGGRASKKGQWPWQVAILNKHRHAFCGGTMIDQHWVLTAAHCVRKTLYIRLGEHNLDKDDGNELDVKVTKSYIHPNYDTDTVDSDLALLQLHSSPGEHNLACLPQPGQQPPRNKLCTIIGWGKRKASDLEGTPILQQTEVFVMPDEKCRDMYESYYISENMFCAGHTSSRRDSCAGDSGGPLLCRIDDRWTIFGVTSFGEGCGKKGKFGVYTLVPNYVEWIRETING